ncbi:LacI family transcriptional regulator [Hydrogenispora ethanolica]|uniref:LacI family transcriptional regulator n=1 Tax=Hydrogenispora ethanolica TaxID=1082276 RepID=A0A4R1R786_HYDET|nr:LacI family transcriptional regulator [Hydrogenispora ethanolica]
MPPIDTLKKISIKDVAKAAGVSITTVSRVLNNSYPVNEQTKQKVLETVDKLNFQPNAIARGLVSKKTHTIGISVPYITNMFFTEVVQGIADQLKRIGYSLILSHTQGDGDEEMKVIQNFLNRQVDGIIIMDPFIESVSPEFYREIHAQIPTVIVNKYFSSDELVFVINDEEQGAYEGTDYLLRLGHRKLVFVSGFDGYASNVKRAGFMKALAHHRIPDEDYLILEGDFTSEGTYRLLRKELKRLKNYSAIFCANDLMAIGAMKALRSQGYQVPQDFSVLGFDNIGISSLFIPGITTVSQNIYDLGRVSGQTIIKLLEGKKVPSRHVLKTSLVIRESCQEVK